MNYRINLLPPELQPRPPVEGKRLAVIAGLTVLAALILIGGAGWLIRSYSQRVELAAVQSQLDALQPVVHKVQAEQAEVQKLQAGAAALEGLLARHRVWKPVLDDIAGALPVDMWLTSEEAGYDKDAAKAASSAPGAGTQAAGKGTSGSTAPAAAGSPAGTSGGALPGTNAVPTSGPLVGQPAQPPPSATGEATGQQNAAAQEQIPLPPNVLTIKGISRSFPSIGVLVRKLSVLPYFRRVSLKEVSSRDDGTLSFTVICYLQQ